MIRARTLNSKLVGFQNVQLWAVVPAAAFSARVCRGLSCVSTAVVVTLWIWVDRSRALVIPRHGDKVQRLVQQTEIHST